MMAGDKLPYVIALTHLYSSRLRLLREVLKAYPDPAEAWERITLAGKSASWQRAQEEMEFVHKHQIQTYSLKPLFL